jgi:hypothetical protein
VVVGGDIGHVPALFEQSVDIAIYGISDNFRYPVPAQAHLVADFLLGPAQAGKADDHSFAAGCLPGTDIRDPGVHGLAADPEFVGQGGFRVGVVRVCRGNVSGNALFVGKGQPVPMGGVASRGQASLTCDLGLLSLL